MTPGLSNYIVYRRTDRQHDLATGNRGVGDLDYISSALCSSPQAALEEIARREGLDPGKYLVMTIDLLNAYPGTVTHRVVMD